MKVDQIDEVVDTGIKAGTWAEKHPLGLAALVMLFSIFGTWKTMNSRIVDQQKKNEECEERNVIISQDRDRWRDLYVPTYREARQAAIENREKIDSLIQK